MFRNILTGALSIMMASMPVAAQAEVTLGGQAPDFKLTDMHGKPATLSRYKGKYVVLEWTNPKCPFVRKHYGSGNMQRLQRTYTKRGVVWLSINSAAAGREGYSTPEQALATSIEQKGAPTDVLLDPTGQVGHLYGARTTPHMFIISPAGRILYMGGIDSIPSNKPEDLPKAKNFVAAALNEALAGKPVTVKTSMPYGCSVKYAL
ncbi:thioredoxin family protein [Sphingobium sp.]|uniref:thioredoxin family protein n=1 Tax=Sphingobium sp. TaxID=1912891 RepID=UPI0028BF314A|nr:thioredoxin family protein [Sphingobium sp.]